MKIKDYSTFVDDKGEIPLTERIRGTLQFGSNWYPDIQAQELIIDRFQNALDDSFTLLRNLTLRGLDVPIPITLIGPTGIQVIYTSAIKGIFQAKGEQWLAMAANSRQFKPSRPNLMNRILLLTRAVERHMERCGFSNLAIEPVVIFTDPGIHVDTERPAVRIVMIDALDRYAAGLAQAEAMIGQDDVRKINRMLTDPPADVFHSDETLTEEDKMLEKALSTKPYSTDSPIETPSVNVPFIGPVRFTSRQWLVLGVLVAINVVVLAVFILVALSIA